MAVALLAGCQALEAVPNMDHGSAGCHNMRGPAVAPALPSSDELVGRTPAQAGAFARAMGHVVVWNRQTANYGECWCVPPPAGEVTGSFLGSHNVLYITVAAPNIQTSGEDQPANGWGC